MNNAPGTDPLLDYIRTNAATYTRVAITRKLLKAGFSRLDIDRAWTINPQNTPPKQKALTDDEDSVGCSGCWTIMTMLAFIWLIFFTFSALLFVPTQMFWLTVTAVAILLFLITAFATYMLEHVIPAWFIIPFISLFWLVLLAFYLSQTYLRSTVSAGRFNVLPDLIVFAILLLVLLVGIALGARWFQHNEPYFYRWLAYFALLPTLYVLWAVLIYGICINSPTR